MKLVEGKKIDPIKADQIARTISENNVEITTRILTDFSSKLAELRKTY